MKDVDLDFDICQSPTTSSVDSSTLSKRQHSETGMEFAFVDAADVDGLEHDESKHLCHINVSALVVAVAPFSRKHRKISLRLCFCVS